MTSSRGILALAGLAALLPLVASGGEGAEKAPEKFVVHEWGVYIRRMAIIKSNVPWRDPKGKAKPKSLLTVPDELVAGLPAFVLRHDKEFTPKKDEFRSWRKPVLHLYGREGLEVSVQVLTFRGRPLVYWPKPELVTETFWSMGAGVTDAVGMKWKGRLTAKRPADARKVGKSHWWSTVRAVPGKWIRTAGGSERFLFYEATAIQKPPLEGKVSAEAITLKNAQKTASGPVIVIVNDGKTRNFVAIKNVAAGATVTLARKDVLKAGGDAKKLLAACRAQWRAFGLTGEEAAAIVETWRPDLLGKTGFLVAARVPSKTYDAIFPLKVTPKPDELVRAGVVFDTLPGEDARLNWLPAIEETMKKWAKDLASEEFKVREAARKRFSAAGDLARPFLQKLTKSSDDEVRSSATNLLKGLEPGVVTLPVHGKGSRPVHVKRR